MRNPLHLTVSNTQTPKARIRGSIVASRLTYVAARWGDTGRQVVLTAMPARDRKRAEGIAVDGDWFDYATLDRVDRAIASDLADGDESVLRALGRASAAYNLERLLSARVADLDVRATIERVGRMNLFQDFGSGACESLDGGLALTYDYPDEVTEIYCASAVGFFEGLLDALGCEEPSVVEVSCRSRGGCAHRYELRWREARRRVVAEEPSHAPADDSGQSESGGNSADADPALENAFAALYRQALAGGEPSARGVLQRPGGRSNSRVFALVAVATILAVLVIARWVAATEANGASTPVDPIRSYERTGDLLLELRFDRPLLRLETSAPLVDGTLTIHQFGKAYTLTLASIPSNAFLEAEIAAFTAADGTHPDATRPPTFLTVRARTDGTMVRSEFRLE